MVTFDNCGRVAVDAHPNRRPVNEISVQRISQIKEKGNIFVTIVFRVFVSLIVLFYVF